MTEKSQEAGGYGYAEHVPVESIFTFGLNAGITHLKKFEWTPNGGKDGAEQEALDIVFDVKGKDFSYRKFPIQKAYYKDDSTKEQLETEDPNHAAFKQEQANLSAVLVHILGAFVTKEEIREALSNPIASFKDYCKILMGLLPSNYPTKKLDLFFNWQWQIKGENSKTFLELPKNMKHGKWICASVVPAGGKWEKQQKENASDDEVALRYVDKEGNVHPFKRRGWFMNSHFAEQQKEDDTAASTAMNEGSSSKPGGW